MTALVDINQMHSILGQLLHEWQRIEGNLFSVYVAREGEFSNHRLLATTFHHIRSFETKLSLVDKVLNDHLEPTVFDQWRTGLKKPLTTEGQIRNNIVHGQINGNALGEPVITPFYGLSAV